MTRARRSSEIFLVSAERPFHADSVEKREGSRPFCDLTLARRLERAEGAANARFVETRAQVFPDSGACWREVAGTYAMFDTPTSPVSQTFGLGMFSDVRADDLEELEQFFITRGASVFHEVSPLASPATAELLDQRGYRPVEFTNVLYRSLTHEQPGQNEDTIPVRLVREDESANWAQVMASGWSHVQGFTEFFADMAKFPVQRPGTCSFFAEIAGRPVATGVLCLHEDIALLGGACTIPEERRRGAQTALLEGRLRHAVERGCDVAMMCAAPGSSSQRNAERQGFRVAYTRIKWQLRTVTSERG